MTTVLALAIPKPATRASVDVVNLFMIISSHLDIHRYIMTVSGGKGKC